MTFWLEFVKSKIFRISHQRVLMYHDSPSSKILLITIYHLPHLTSIALLNTGLLVLQVADNKQVGSVIGYVYASDADSGSYGRITYRITNIYKGTHHFSVLPNGALVLSFPVDHRNIAEYLFSVVASDNNIKRQLSSSVNVTITIIDSTPRFQNSSYKAAVEENIPVGTEVMRVKADVPKAVVANHTYAIVSNQTLLSSLPEAEDYLSIHPLTGVISIKGKFSSITIILCGSEWTLKQ